MNMKKLNYGMLLFLLVSSSWGCSYKLQNSHNELYFKEGVQTIYVAPIVNNSYKAGVENTVYNQLVRTLSSHQRITLVHNRIDADAVLKGIVNSASFNILASTPASSLKPTNLGVLLTDPNRIVATQYNATIQCSFALHRNRVERGQKDKAILIWSASFSLSKPFPASNQLGPSGTTSPLINESEFDRALSDLATSMMANVHESMLAMF